MEDIFKNCELQINKIEAELKRLNVWSSQPIDAAKFNDMGAFGINTMAFTEWLQFVLVPRVHSILETNGTFPKQSNVAAHAYREFDGMEKEFGELCQLLSEFDALFK